MVVVDLDRLFIAGGESGLPYSNSALMYSSSTDKWETLDDMPTGRNYMGCGVVTSANGQT
jgi:hypothetical protein